MSAEVLSKLTAKMRQITGEGFGGSPSLTSDIVAGALAGMHPLGYMLILAKYTDDEFAKHMLWRDLAAEIAKEKNCNMLIAKGAALACFYPVLSPLRCTHCKGRGMVYPKLKGMTVDQSAHQCYACEGSGLGSISNRQKAAMACIPPTTWHESWKDYAAKKEQFLWGLEASCISRLNAQLRDAA